MISHNPITTVLRNNHSKTSTRAPNEKDRTLEDFLYAFSIHYSLLVKDAQSAGQKLPNRAFALKRFCQRWLNEGNTTTRLNSVLQSIIEAKDITIQMRPGVWVPSPLFMFDAWFQLLIGRKYRPPQALDIPVKWLNELSDLSTAHALSKA